MPNPSDGECNLYSGYNIPMVTLNHTKGHPDVYRGAVRHYKNPPPPPPPPGPCVGPQPLNGSALPAWPRYTASTVQNIKFDLCNISVEAHLKAEVCKNWDAWLPAGSDEERSAMSRMSLWAPSRRAPGMAGLRVGGVAGQLDKGWEEATAKAARAWRMATPAS